MQATDLPRSGFAWSGGGVRSRLALLLGVALLGGFPLASIAADVREAADAFATRWWREAQDDLFAGIALSAKQRAGVDAILAEAADERARIFELTAILEAPGAEDAEPKARARAELAALHGQRDPTGRIDAMRELLSEDQQTLFDRNRRLRSDRVFAKQKQRHERAAERRSRGSGAKAERQEPAR